MVRKKQTLLYSQLACNEMQASALNLKQTRGRQHDRKFRLKSIYFHHHPQGISTNHYLILGLRDKAAPPTSQQINKFPPKRVKKLATPSSIFIFIFSSSAGNTSNEFSTLRASFSGTFLHTLPKFGYATEVALFISAQLSTDAVSVLRKLRLLKPVLNWANVCSRT